MAAVVDIPVRGTGFGCAPRRACQPVDTRAFSAGINAVPLMAVEFMHAATERDCVHRSGDDVLPLLDA